MKIPDTIGEILVEIVRGTSSNFAANILADFISLRKDEENINSKIDKAYTSLKETSNLIKELEDDLLQRTEKVKELKTKYEEYSQLAKIEEEKAAPLLKRLEYAVNKGKNSERIISFAINIIAGILIFILGIWASPKINDWLNDSEKQEMIEPIKESQENQVN